jgi:phosphoglycolate phosphatase-like HAD superfamily hydrolase
MNSSLSFHQTQSPKKKLIIFDYDGVIMDSFPEIYSAYKIICSELNKKIPKTAEEFRNIQGNNFVDLFNNLGIKTQKEQLLAGELFFREIKKTNPKIFIGIKKVLEELQKNYLLAVITSNYQNEVEQKLWDNSLRDYFSVVLGKVDFDPKHFSKDESIEELVKKFGLQKNEVLLIGDRLSDYLEGTKAGLKNILLVEYGWSDRINEAENKIKYSVKSPLEILDAIKAINF